jgi:predicted Zn-dependent protease
MDTGRIRKVGFLTSHPRFKKKGPPDWSGLADKMIKHVSRVRICRIYRLVLLCLPLVLPLQACMTLRNLEQKATYITIPPAQETHLGIEFSKEIEKEIEIIHDPEAQAWINDAGRQLLAHSPPTEQDFTFKITTGEEVNAFAIPGGFCYVNLGLIRLAENEAEVLAVVGHEINHVTRRHGVRSMQRAIGVDLLIQILSGEKAEMVRQVQQAGGVLAMRKFGRDDEREADRLGVDAMYRAGYDPRAAISFFEKMMVWAEEQGGGGDGIIRNVFSTHPATRERIENIRRQVSSYPISDSLRTDSEQFRRIRKRLTGE